MDGLRFPVAIHLHGTLAANAQGAFALPIGMTLESVCACASNDSDAKLQLGLADDVDRDQSRDERGGGKCRARSTFSAHTPRPWTGRRARPLQMENAAINDPRSASRRAHARSRHLRPITDYRIPAGSLVAWRRRSRKPAAADRRQTGDAG